MLTNLYYYDYYRPYILKNENLKSINRRNTTKSNEDTSSSYSSEANESTKSFSFFLNKSLKNEIINYASTISKDFNSMKDTARFMSNKLNKNNLSDKENIEDISNGLDDFVNEYNEYLDFAEDNYENSNVLRDYAENVITMVSENKDYLAQIGININEDKKLTIDKTKFEKNINNITDISENIKKMYNDIYEDTCAVMNMPLSQHMNFKNLSYYYNYKYASIDYKTFNITDTGMLVDIRL